jgi:DNA-binding MurR/RpiR family transcriptional regulator
VISSGKEDVALLISFARYSEHSLHLAAQLHRQHIPIICIGDAASPVAPLAASCFVVDRKPGLRRQWVWTGAVAVVEALLRGTAARIGVGRSSAAHAR